MRAVVLALLLSAPCMAFAAPVINVQLTTAPQNPEPESQIEVRATALGFDPTGSVFTWIVDDEQVAEGRGLTTLTTDTPKLGETRTVRLVVNGDERATPLVLKPARVTVEWEANTSRPPLYSGRPLLGGQGSIRAVAVPELVTSSGARIPAGQIRFTWKQNGNILSKQSGYGATSVTVSPPFYNRPFTLSVEAEAGGLRAEHTVGIQAVPVDSVIYRTTPLMGELDYTAVTSDYEFTEQEVTFMAHPLHASQSDTLIYQWKLNNQPITVEGGDPRVAVFRKTGNGTGAYAVTIEMTNPASFLDRVVQSFLLHF